MVPSLQISCIIVIFQVIRHIKLNRPDNPCKPSLNYSMTQCVEEYIMRKVQCKPPWMRFILEGGFPLCDNWTLLNNYANELKMSIYESDRLGIIKKTKCLMPCSFLEYRVDI